MENGNYSNIYNGDDLLAIVFNQTDLISSAGDFVIWVALVNVFEKFQSRLLKLQQFPPIFKLLNE